MATMTTPTPTDGRSIPGGTFSSRMHLQRTASSPRTFTEEHRQTRRLRPTCDDEIVPASDQIEAKDLLRDAAPDQAGKRSRASPRSISPRRYGGLEMDRWRRRSSRTTSPSKGSFSVAFSAHVGIGTLLSFGTARRSRRRSISPKLAEREFIGAYALSESTSGSDAVNARTRCGAVGGWTAYTLNGEKMWDTNAGFADLFTIFAKCEVKDGKDAGKERLTAFLVEKERPASLSARRNTSRYSRQLHLPADSGRLQDTCVEPAW